VADLRLSVDLETLRTTGDARAVAAPATSLHWSADRGACIVCTLEPGGDSAGSAERAAAAARLLLGAYGRAPGRWPDLPHLVAAAAIVDLRRREVHAAVDRMGVHNLYWARHGGVLRIASRAADVLAGDGQSREIDPAAVYGYVYFHNVPSPLAIFRGSAKLPRAHALHCRDGDVAVTRYRTETFCEHAPQDIDALADELLATLRSAVSRSLDDEPAAGAFLSGGLDSSTVAGLMSQSPGRGPPRSFSIGFDAEGYDEMEYARIAARHFGLQAHEHYMTPDELLAVSPGLLRATDEPFGNASIAPAYRCALLARDAGVSRLLAGDGGDELFAGNSRYATQLLFERYGRLPAPLRGAVLEPLLLPLGRALPGTPLGKVARYIEQAKVPLPERLQSYNYLHRHAPAEVFTRRFLESVDQELPLRMWQAEFSAPSSGDAVDRMLFLDWAFTLHDSDLIKVNSACRTAGVPVAYPMLDHDLVEFSCRIPGALKMHRDRLRWFYKRAVRTLLPAQILAKRKHGFGLPFGVWTSTHPGLRRLAETSLESLAQRDLFRAEFLRQVLQLHRESHAAYYGVLVWVLMALELWLQANTGPGAVPPGAVVQPR
jgi:asparagine synthase (glutamine-hydrolysing)